MARSDYQFTPHFAQPKQLTQPSLTVKQLAMAADFEDRYNSKTVRFRDIQAVGVPKGLPKEMRCMRGRTITDENGHQYSPRIFYTGDRLTSDSKVIADCQCGRWVFTYETANAHKGAAFLYRSNGDPPSVRNPRQKIGLCKHLYVMGRYLVKQGLKQQPNRAARRATGA